MWGAANHHALRWGGLQFWRLECEELPDRRTCTHRNPIGCVPAADAHKLKGNFGGYGSGKTLTDVQEALKHLIVRPNATC